MFFKLDGSALDLPEASLSLVSLTHIVAVVSALLLDTSEFDSDSGCTDLFAVAETCTVESSGVSKLSTVGVTPLTGTDDPAAVSATGAAGTATGLPTVGIDGALQL